MCTCACEYRCPCKQDDVRSPELETKRLVRRSTRMLENKLLSSAKSQSLLTRVISPAPTLQLDEGMKTMCT